MKNNFGMYAVRDELSGEIDVEATMNRFHTELQAQVAHETNDLDAIAGAVSTVFNKHPNVNIKTDSVIHAVLRELNVDVMDDKPMVKRIRTYLQDNADDTRESGKTYKCNKGQNGGICRWSEYTEKPAKTTKKSRDGNNK